MKYRLLICPALEISTKQKVLEFDTQTAAVVALETAASLLLFLQDEIKVMPDCSNSMIIEQFVDGEWEYVDEAELGEQQ